MKKPKTIAQTWNASLLVWRHIAHVYKDKAFDYTYSFYSPINDTKIEWMRKHGFQEGEVLRDCFFCQFNEENEYQNGFIVNACQNCPGKLISKTFHCGNNEDNDGVCWFNTPKAFYQKLVHLNEIRIKNNKTKK